MTALADTVRALREAHGLTQADLAAQLAKTDLLTDMVGEFPELQGTMGRYYALNDGLGEVVADAIEDHYKPRFAGDALPRGEAGIAVALMGRNHPLGVLLAALLFGALQQGGAELAFEIPSITREMVVVIQGLIILFCGAMENLYAPAIAKLLKLKK